MSVASPAVEVTSRSSRSCRSRATPGVKAPKLTGAPSVSDSVAGTVPPTGTPGTVVLWKNVVGVSVGLPAP